jgi:hypothetical protein
MFLNKSRQETHAVTALFSALTVTAFHAFPAVPAITAELTPAASRYRFYLNEL